MKEEKDSILVAAKAAAILGGAFAMAGLVLSGGRAAFSVAIGAAIAVANLLTMRAIIRAMLPGDDEEGSNKDEDAEGAKKPSRETSRIPNAVHREVGRRGGAAWGVFAVLKIFLLFGGVWILLTRGLVDPIPLVVGYGVLPLGIAASAVWSSIRGR